MRSRFALLYPLAGVVLIVALWALACWLISIPTVVLPSPDKVLRALIVRGDLLLNESWITLKETLYGFVLALLIGLPLAVAVANSRNETSGGPPAATRARVSATNMLYRWSDGTKAASSERGGTAMSAVPSSTNAPCSPLIRISKLPPTSGWV